MMRFFALAALLFSATQAFADQTRTVNCDEGQSLNFTLATLTKLQLASVTVKGTCTEYVLVDRVYDLTLTGTPGATLQQPSPPPPPGLSFVLSIKASRSMSVINLAFHSLPSALSSIGIGGGSNQVRVPEETTHGFLGIFVYEDSQKRLGRVKVQNTTPLFPTLAFD